MKAVFTCDDVFDILTREPFPSGGANDEFVESHLAVCHECRHLAEAFRPAVGLFHESLAAGFDDELPMYRGRLMPIIDGWSRREQRRSGMRRALAIAASLIVVGSVIFAALAAKQRASGIAPVAASVRIHENRDLTLLAALEIPVACRSGAEAAKLTAAADMACCTKCHNADSPITSTEKAIVKSSAACVACHDGLLGEAFSAIEYDRLRTRFRKSFDVIQGRWLANRNASADTVGGSGRCHFTCFELVMECEPTALAAGQGVEFDRFKARG